MSTPGGLLPANFERIWVRGQFIDLGGFPLRGTVTFTASPAVLLDRATKHIISNRRFDSVLLDNTGTFAIELPATNDPDIIPVDWTYTVKEPTGRTYNIKVPYDTPRVDNPADPFDGERVIELIDIVPSPSASGGTVQLMRGVGVNSATTNSAGALVLGFTDNSTSAPIPLGTTPDTVCDWTTRADGEITHGVKDDFGNSLAYVNNGTSYAQNIANRLDWVVPSAHNQTAIYLNRQLGTPVGKLGMSWGYAGITTGGSLCLAVWDQETLSNQGNINCRCHLTVYPTGWDYSVFQNGNYTNVSSGTFTPTLPANRKLWTEVTFAGDTAIVHLPNGQVVRLHDQRIGTLDFCTVPGWEFFKQGTPNVFYQAIYSMYAWRAKPWPLT